MPWNPLSFLREELKRKHLFVGERLEKLYNSLSDYAILPQNMNL